MRNSGENKPKVSIVIPSFNRRQFLPETIESVVSQTFTNWECLVVDDRSTDDTGKLIQERFGRDPRVIFVTRTRPVKGACACRNEGLERARGDYVIFLDSDDILLPIALENRVQIMDNNSKIDFAVFPYYVFRKTIGDKGSACRLMPSESSALDRFLACHTPWQTTGPIWRRKSLDKIGGWAEDLPSWQDWDLHIRALLGDMNYKVVNEPDYYWRITRTGSITWASVFLPHHLRSHEQILIKMVERFWQAGKLNAARLQRIVRLLAWVAAQWASQGNAAEGVRIWRLCRKHRLIGVCQYWRGLVCFRLLPMSFGNRYIRRVMRVLLLMDIEMGLGRTRIISDQAVENIQQSWRL
ncbi:MAG: GalNAc(5)-diNAcBac-PP-undecaprenol beta-1,3-glucosyltransferase [bacterium ADurb.Bin400]|nr:MAG: GalNAc(5)-diNAcBac-PP-undecaprenol beta-1,3-glucosyltransferase [bacterium ADurb.Bin400]